MPCCGPQAELAEIIRRAHRRRGLARLAKLATIRWAEANGVEWRLTANAEANAGMRALNESLGYRPAGTQAFYVRDALS